MVADRLVMLSDLDTDIIQIAVDTVGFEAFACLLYTSDAADE